jgi:DNA-binding NarL/FixJ family response regulator
LTRLVGQKIGLSLRWKATVQQQEGLANFVDFDERHARRVVHTIDYGAVVSRRQIQQQHRILRCWCQGKRACALRGRDNFVRIRGQSRSVVLKQRSGAARALSDREFVVLRLIASGKTPTAIAREPGLSVKTINTYRMRILEKMDMANNAELTHYAIQSNLI